MLEEPTPPKPEKEEDSMEAIRKEIDAQPIKERAILEQMLELMKDEKGRKLFLRMISVSKMESVRPQNWSKASNAPYYRKDYAEWIRLTVDEVINTGTERILLYTDYPKLSKKTLQSRCFQAFDFLVKEMDTEDFRYRNAREKIAISKETRGIMLVWKHAQDLDKVGSPVKFGGAANSKLKDDVNEWVNKAEAGTKFERKGLQLNEDEIDYFRTMFVGIISVRVFVNHESIKILKLTDEQIQLLKETEDDHRATT